MKNVLFSGFLAVILAVFSTVNLSAEESKTVSYKSSMHCNGCKSTIMKTLKAENGIQDIEADVETNIVTVKYDPAKTDETKIADKIKKAGYKADVTTNTGSAKSSSGCTSGAKKSSECGSVKSGPKGECGGSTKTKKTAA
jgi:mercuric ion binding protein